MHFIVVVGMPVDYRDAADFCIGTVICGLVLVNNSMEIIVW